MNRIFDIYGSSTSAFINAKRAAMVFTCGFEKAFFLHGSAVLQLRGRCPKKNSISIASHVVQKAETLQKNPKTEESLKSEEKPFDDKKNPEGFPPPALLTTRARCVHDEI